MAQHSRPLPSPQTTALPPLVRPSGPPATTAASEPPIDDARPADRAQPSATPASPALSPFADAERTPAGQPNATDLPWYRTETWLAVVLTALVPIVLAVVVPGWPKLALLGLGGCLTVLGMAMLVRRERELRVDRRSARSVHPRAH